MLRDCSVAREIWQKIPVPKAKQATFKVEIKEWLRVNTMVNEVHVSALPWNMIFLHVIWMIWKQ